MFDTTIYKQQYTHGIQIVINLITPPIELPKEVLDHPLQGEYCDFKELHISGDLLLIYRVANNTLSLLEGSHSQLFK